MVMTLYGVHLAQPLSNHDYCTLELRLTHAAFTSVPPLGYAKHHAAGHAKHHAGAGAQYRKWCGTCSR